MTDFDTIGLSTLALKTAEYWQKNPKTTLCLVLKNTSDCAWVKKMLISYLPNIKESLLSFPDWETLAYDAIDVHPSLTSERIKTLTTLSQNKQGLVITTENAFFSVCPSRSFIDQQTLAVKVGQSLAFKPFIDALLNKGYTQTQTLETVGQIVTRGGIMDITPMGSRKAYRLEWFDDEIDSIRELDQAKQCSVKRLDAISFAPGQEFSYDPPQISQTQLAKYFDPSAQDQYPLSEINKQNHFSGMQYYLPLFQPEQQFLLDYFDQKDVIVLSNNIHDSHRQWLDQLSERYQVAKHHHPVMSPETLSMSTEKLNQLLCTQNIVHWSINDTCKQYKPLQSIKLSHEDPQGCQQLKAYFKDYQVRFMMPNKSKAHNLNQHLKAHQIIDSELDCREVNLSITTPPPSSCIHIGELNQGFIDNTQQILWAAESDLIGRASLTTATKPSIKPDQPGNIQSFKPWTQGTRLVHRDYGIGAFQCLQTLDNGQGQQEFLLLTYQNDDKLLVPMSQLHCLTRYVGPQGNQVKLDKLGSGQWEKRKKKALQAVEDLSAQLLMFHARRQSKQATALKLDHTSYYQFCEDFPYETTEGQQQAIDSVLADVQTQVAMDRLICGDVGFGKTEVALRAAFVAIMNGYQVALLAPTTVLAGQHYETFKQRFASWPIETCLLSRYSKANKDDDLVKIKQGSIDMVIATHQLLQANVKFKHLALLIVDEEHRFGVKHKEMIHHLRGQSHILSLSATPIPRTLNMAMSQLRSFSIIATPPNNRHPVHSLVYQYQDHWVKEAIQRELMRGGQVYYLQNDIKQHPRLIEQIKHWFPQSHVVNVHGQMKKNELENHMQQFYAGQAQVLVCSTIIESGIDVPTANTIIIQRADLLGLSQLHQLRGRVGRSNHQAYAYFLTPQTSLLTKEAQSRLESITQHQGLGSGLNIAMEDLEIRGAGDLLGSKQSGNISSIGLELYSQYVNKAAKSNQVASHINTSKAEIDTDTTALIPESYIPDPISRLEIYRQLQSFDEAHDIATLKQACEDKYGMMPEVMLTLLAKHLVELRLTQCQAKKLVIRKHQAILKPGHDCLIHIPSLLETGRQMQTGIQLSPKGLIIIQLPNKLTLDLDKVRHLDRLFSSIKLISKTV